MAMTNADKIRSMSDEQLAEWLNNNGDIDIFCDNKCPDFDGHCNYNEHTCRNAWLKWLKQEHKEV
jgi:hypothetical protein